MPHYSDERNAQIIVFGLKEAGVKRIIASPGSTNVAFTWSVQSDPFFEVYSAPDERSAAYMACGLASESGEPVAISCTGATSSRDYMPGLTEAFYRKLPIVAVESMSDARDIGNNTTQILDRGIEPRDVCRYHTRIDIVKDARDYDTACLEVSRALSALTENGGGPVIIELITENTGSFTTKRLPDVRIVKRFDSNAKQSWPEIPRGARILVYIGAHARFTPVEIKTVEAFAKRTGAAVLVDATSGYCGTAAISGSLAACQLDGNPVEAELTPDLVIHLGEASGAYDMSGFVTRLDVPVWRVSPDGVLRKAFRRLDCLFNCDVADFFSYYADYAGPATGYADSWRRYDASLRIKIPELPFSNPWIAQQLEPRVPAGSTVHPAILNSLLSWNFFMSRGDIITSANVGGFGIDGCLSTLVGASLARPGTLHFSIVGDLSFFYDMNVLGNRHVGPNLRVLLINNGVGMTFKQTNHFAHRFGEEANAFIAAGGHNIPHALVPDESPLSGVSPARAWAESLGFGYLSARGKEEFSKALSRFVGESECPLLFECFTAEDDERLACDLLRGIDGRKTAKGGVKKLAKSVLPQSAIAAARKAIKK